MVGYDKIESEELGEIIGDSYDLLRYVFEVPGLAPQILKWDGNLEGKEKMFSYDGLVPHPLVMNTIYFSCDRDLFGVVLPIDNHVSVTKLGKFLGMSGKQAKSKLRLSNSYPTNQSPGNLSPFITEEDDNVTIFHSIGDPPTRLVDHSCPGRSDVSLIMRCGDSAELLAEKFGYHRIKMVSLEEIAK